MVRPVLSIFCAVTVIANTTVNVLMHLRTCKKMKELKDATLRNSSVLIQIRETGRSGPNAAEESIANNPAASNGCGSHSADFPNYAMSHLTEAEDPKEEGNKFNSVALAENERSQGHVAARKKRSRRLRKSKAQNEERERKGKDKAENECTLANGSGNVRQVERKSKSTIGGVGSTTEKEASSIGGGKGLGSRTGNLKKGKRSDAHASKKKGGERKERHTQARRGSVGANNDSGSGKSPETDGVAKVGDEDRQSGSNVKKEARAGDRSEQATIGAENGVDDELHHSSSMKSKDVDVSRNGVLSEFEEDARERSKKNGSKDRWTKGNKLSRGASGSSGSETASGLESNVVKAGSRRNSGAHDKTQK